MDIEIAVSYKGSYPSAKAIFLGEVLRQDELTQRGGISFFFRRPEDCVGIVRVGYGDGEVKPEAKGLIIVSPRKERLKLVTRTLTDLSESARLGAEHYLIRALMDGRNYSIVRFENEPILRVCKDRNYRPTRALDAATKAYHELYVRGFRESMKRDAASLVSS